MTLVVPIGLFVESLQIKTLKLQFFSSKPEFFITFPKSSLFTVYVICVCLFTIIKQESMLKGTSQGVFYYGFLSGKEEKPDDIRATSQYILAGLCTEAFPV